MANGPATGRDGALAFAGVHGDVRIETDLKTCLFTCISSCLVSFGLLLQHWHVLGVTPEELTG